MADRMTRPPRPGIVVTPIWHDEHMIELYVEARSATFAGATSVYQNFGSLRGAAQRLAGFPRSPADRRELEWGSRTSKRRTGWARLSFFCGDLPGHAFVRVELEAERDPGGESVTLLIPIEAAAVDRFVQALRDGDETDSEPMVLEASIDALAWPPAY